MFYVLLDCRCLSIYKKLKYATLYIGNMQKYRKYLKYVKYTFYVFKC